MTTTNVREALENLLRYAERNTCPHESTYRGGAIWTICSECGMKWADDKGGFPGYVEPPEFEAARKALSHPSPAPQSAEVRAQAGDGDWRTCYAELLQAMLCENGESHSAAIEYARRIADAYKGRSFAFPLGRIMRCRYPVSPKIQPRGWDWDLSRLDEVVAELSATPSPEPREPAQPRALTKAEQGVMKRALLNSVAKSKGGPAQPAPEQGGAVAIYVRDGIADWIETNVNHREFWTPEVVELIRSIEIKLPERYAAPQPAPEKAEAVHWRAVLAADQVPQQVNPALHVVGFRNLKAAEAYVATEKDFNGWNYTIEPLYTRPTHPEQKAEAAVPAVERCPCGYPQPCSVNVPIGFCKSGIAPTEGQA